MHEIKPLYVRDLYEKYRERLEIDLLEEVGLDREIAMAEAERPGLCLAGYTKNRTEGRILIFGRAEIDFLDDMDEAICRLRLDAILDETIPAIIVARGLKPITALTRACEERGIPIFTTSISTMRLYSALTMILSEEFSQQLSCHGTFVEAFGLGVLITGDSAVGKSEAALGLIERGHRLITDDVVRIKKREGSYLEGSGSELTRHLLEIRGIGIINVAHLYGAVCVSEKQRLDIIVHLEAWNDAHFYDRVGLEDHHKDYLGIKVPHHLVPVKPGRDIVLLIETLVLNHRLKGLGYNSAKEFNVKLLETIAMKHQSKSEVPP